MIGSTLLGNLASFTGGGAVVSMLTLAGNAAINVLALLGCSWF